MKTITGTHVHYYAVCLRKLWYFDHGIRLEDFNEDVKIGTLIHENSYLRSDKEVKVDQDVTVDFIDENGEIHEIKKSSKMKEAHILQLKYYMFRAMQQGIEVKKGVLHYPDENTVEEVLVTDTFHENWTDIEADIRRVVDELKPPKRKVSMRLCRRCAYYELCHCA